MTGRWGSDRRASDRGGHGRNAPAPAILDVAEQLRQLDCDPIAGMAKIAQDDASTDRATRPYVR